MLSIFFVEKKQKFWKQNFENFFLEKKNLKKKMEYEEFILSDWSPPDNPARPCRP